MHLHRVKYRDSGRQLQGMRQRGIRLHSLHPQNSSAVAVSTLQDFFVNVAHRQGAGNTVQLRHHGARTCDPSNDTLNGQLLHCAVDSHAAHPELLLQSGLDWGVSQLLVFSSVVAALALAALTVGGRVLASELMVGLTLGMACLPGVYVQLKRASRLRAIQTQLPDALDLIGRALRSGQALTASLKMAGDEMSGPLARELRMTHDEVNFGVSLHQALSNLGHRVPVTDLRYFTIAVLVQRETGGNLMEVLSNLSRLMRERLKLQSKVRVMTAEGRISAWALGSLPFALVALMHWGNPEFISVLWTDPVGIELTQVTLGLMLLGCLWLWRLTQVRV